jgi:RHS repeat-associated protein
VFVRYAAGPATNAPYTITDGTGTATTKPVDQTQQAGAWVSLGRFPFNAGLGAKIVLSDQANNTVVADAVMLVRDNSADAAADAAERKANEYLYDPNGNLTTINDTSPGAAISTYDITPTQLNQLDTVTEKAGSTTKHTTHYTYDPNGNPDSRTHDSKPDTYTYDPRDLVSQVKNFDSATDPSPKVTSFTYTPRGQRLKETKANGNTVDYDYFLDGLLQHQLEKKPGGTLVSEHTLDYDPNGNRKADTSKTMNADNHAALIQRAQTATYDPRDRIATLTKTDPTSGATVDSEAYVHDANDNVISQTRNNVTTTSSYDRNRLQRSVTGSSTANYNYDPFGRLDSVTSGTQVLQRFLYDGFDRVSEYRQRISAGVFATTRYGYDPLDRTASKTDNVGATGEKTTTFNYLGLSNQLADEQDQVSGQVQRTYRATPWGELLSQTKRNTDGTTEDAFYGYDPHSSVETLTDTAGDTKATYGYTAYGQNDDQSFTGVDKPDPANPTKEPYNFYRYTAKRFDPSSGTYDLGFRDYSPGLNRFLTRDLYNGSLDDQKLAIDPFTGNRYTFAAGNPTSMVDQTGHAPTRDNMVSANPQLNVQLNDTRNAGSETLCEKRGVCLGEGWTPQAAREATRDFEAGLAQERAQERKEQYISDCYQVTFAACALGIRYPSDLYAYCQKGLPELGICVSEPVLALAQAYMQTVYTSAQIALAAELGLIGGPLDLGEAAAEEELLVLNIERANFAQKTFSEMFSKGGKFAGRSIDDVAAALRSRAMMPKDVPINVIVRDGNTLILNTRSAQALTRAGIPRSAWYVINRTGDPLFEKLLTGQLTRNGLTSAGTAIVESAG